MNIFALSTNPTKAARMMCDKHIPKMIVESAQMMASALRRHEESVLFAFSSALSSFDDMDELFTHHGVLTKKNTPYKGGYAHHPCTVWTGDSWGNFMWLAQHAQALLIEFSMRFGQSKVHHACWTPINNMKAFGQMMQSKNKQAKTPFAMAMPDEYKREGKEVLAYRDYYFAEKSDFAKWERGRDAPDWWVDKVFETVPSPTPQHIYPFRTEFGPLSEVEGSREE